MDIDIRVIQPLPKERLDKYRFADFGRIFKQS